MRKLILAVVSGLVIFFNIESIAWAEEKAGAQVAESPTGRNPKLLWTSSRQAVWNKMVAENHPWWQRLKAAAEGNPYSNPAGSATVAYQVTGDVKYAKKAWGHLEPFIKEKKLWWDSNFIREYGMDCVLMYDWLYPALSTEQRKEFIDWINWQGDLALRNVKYTWGGTRFNDTDEAVGHYFTLAFLDFTPDNPRAGTFLKDTMKKWAPGIPVGGLTPTLDVNDDLKNFYFTSNYDGVKDYYPIKTLRDNIRHLVAMAKGGVWMESSQYNIGTLGLLLMGAEGVRTATGKDCFPEITELAPEITRALICGLTPDLKDSYQWGDVEEARALTSQGRLAVMLAGFQGNWDMGLYAGKLAEELRAGPEYRTFVFCNPYAPTNDWRKSFKKGLYVPGMGMSFFHDGWASGDSFFGAHMPRNQLVDHEGGVHMGDFQLYRKGKWVVTHPIGYCAGRYTVNAMVLEGSAGKFMLRGPVAQEFGPDEEYAYLAGSTGGSSMIADYRGKQTPLVEWTRSIVYLSSKDKLSDTIIIYDRTDGKPGKEWLIHAPVEPQLAEDAISWETAGKQRVCVRTLLPLKQLRKVYNEKELWAEKGGEGGYTRDTEKKYHVRIIPAVEQKWDTFLNVVQVYDAGWTPKNALVKSDGGKAEGVLIERPGLNDTLLLFSAVQGADIPTKPRLCDLAALRILKSGYTANFEATSMETDILLADLDPGKRWTLLDNGKQEEFKVSTQGLGRAKLKGVGNHIIVLK